MSERIHDMRSYFLGTHQITAPSFADAILRAQKAAIANQIATVGFTPADQVQILAVELKDPRDVQGTPVSAYVNAGRWLAKCECGGAEFVDFETAIFMCCSCWNAQIGHAWRMVVLPTPPTRKAIERLLLLRPEENRHWRGEPVVKLVEENWAHGLRAA